MRIMEPAHDKRDAILETALVLFCERGFYGTPTSLISREAGVATGTIGLDPAGTWAESEERASRPAEARSDERTMKSRRFMPRRLTTNGR